MSTDIYALTPEATALARKRGLVDADWYLTPVAPDVMRELTRRTNGRASVDAALWLGLLVVSGAAVVATFGTWWLAVAMLLYGTLYGGASDARWHEYGHGTAFASAGLNQVGYYLASFMLLREPTHSRWTHVRHHSDTIVVGRDPEIVLQRPPQLGAWLANSLNLAAGPSSLAAMARHATFGLNAAEKSYVPETERRRVVIEARVFLALLAGVFAVAIIARSPIPLLLVGLPTFYGAWLVHVLNVTQHAALMENVADHRLIARTFHMNAIGRFLYLNMNFHIEHHMYPAVPYYRLPALHDAIAHDCPVPNRSLLATYREIIPALLRQRTDPQHQVVRTLPTPPPQRRHRDESAARSQVFETNTMTDAQRDALGFVRVADRLDVGEVQRFDHGDETYAVYRIDERRYATTSGICTHSRTVHLATGTIVGDAIECPKHNGRFDIATGEAVRPPVCEALATFPTEVREDGIWARLDGAEQ